MSWVTFSLLTGIGKPLVVAKTFSTMALVKGGLLFLRPTVAAKKFFGVDVSGKLSSSSLAASRLINEPSEMQTTRAICKALGLNLVINAAYMNMLAFGVEPLRATGLSALTWSILLCEETFVSKVHQSVGRGFSTQVLLLLGSVLLSFAILK
jgi:hypothetical protein